MAKYKDELLDHEYDGIKEMDNDLPKWWLYLFYLSIVWSVIYFVYYTVLGIGYSQEDLYKEEMNPNYKRIVAADAKILGFLPQYTTPFYNSKSDLTPRQLIMAAGKLKMIMLTAATDTMTYTAIIDQAGIAYGKDLFLKNCAQCHGKLGEGGVGPNLTDNYWLHGADISSIVKSVKYGYPVKGMIAWLGTLSEEDIIKTSSYVQTLQGTNPPNARAPQGEIVTE